MDAVCDAVKGGVLGRLGGVEGSQSLAVEDSLVFGHLDEGL